MTAPESNRPNDAKIDDDALLALLHRHASLRAPPLVRELAMFTVDDPVPLWSALEGVLATHIDAPYFVVAWPGAQALARLVLDGSVDVRGRRVVDLGCGSGLAALAAKCAGAASVRAVDVDPLALAVVRVTARHHTLDVDTACDDAFTYALDDADVVLVGDLVSRASHAGRLDALVERARATTARIVVADSGRPFFTPPALSEIARFTVPVHEGFEGARERIVRVYASDP